MTDRGSNHYRSVGTSRRANEEGQTIVLVAVLMVVLLALSAFAIDVGYAYFAHRSLQASADAAALAGAQRLPDSSSATATAREYGTSTAGRNHNDKLGDINETISLRCVSSLPGCDPNNAVAVQESAHVPTFFARVLGIDSFNITAKATACSYCGIKPVDIMLVVDRTGSMCQDHDGNNDPSCADMNNEKTALREFLNYLDPAKQRVGLAVFPPTKNIPACSEPTDYGPTQYVVAQLSNDYATSAGSLNEESQLVHTINCLQAAGRTSYATAIDQAQAELNAHGRSGVARIIIFFSDGAANIGSSHPCQQGVDSAAAAKAAGTTIYSIGYDLTAEDGGANICRNGNDYNQREKPLGSAREALQQIASSRDNFYLQPSAGDLSNVYLQIAADFSQGTSSLIPDDSK